MNGEFASEVVSDKLDPSVGVSWMRCSPGLPDYVQRLERENEELRHRVSAAMHFFHSPQSFSVAEFREVANAVFGDEKYTGRYMCIHADDWRAALWYLWWMVTGKLKSV